MHHLVSLGGIPFDYNFDIDGMMELGHVICHVTILLKIRYIIDQLVAGVTKEIEQ